MRTKFLFTFCYAATVAVFLYVFPHVLHVLYEVERVSHGIR